MLDFRPLAKIFSKPCGGRIYIKNKSLTFYPHQENLTLACGFAKVFYPPPARGRQQKVSFSDFPLGRSEKVIFFVTLSVVALDFANAKS
ncbi:MAG: hypothetical protein QM523_08295, partial [Candidatus Pacebacteria bacterium]|nr:hypothetical protein [Candidatus Paceibacterota bacterium]